MRYLLGGLVIAFMLFMLSGALSGRIKAKTCCNVGDQAQDSRMRSALGNDA